MEALSSSIILPAFQETHSSTRRPSLRTSLSFSKTTARIPAAASRQVSGDSEDDQQQVLDLHNAFDGVMGKSNSNEDLNKKTSEDGMKAVIGQTNSSEDLNKKTSEVGTGGSTRAGLFRTPISGGVQSATSVHDLPKPALAVRNLMEQARFAHLSTVMSRMHQRSEGYPFGSLVDFAPDPMGHPIFSFSQLGIHTRNLLANPRCTLVVQIPGWSGLSNARVTIFGDVYPLAEDEQVTTCKHEFHLQCILEWSQRSQECPICWQVIVLKDPASQELLSMVEDERNGRSVLKVHDVYVDRQADPVVEYDDSDTGEQVIRTFESASRMRYGKRRNMGRLSRVRPSTVDVPIRQEIYTPLEDFHSLGYASSHDTLASSSSMSTSIDQTSPSAGSSTTTVTPDTRDFTIKSRVLNSQSPNGSPGRPIAADMHAFSESVKSKFSAASARYKESISKSTQSLKEKLLATNSPVKELSRGVQREMSAGIAGVARIFERLDPTLKRSSDGVNSNFFKGKCTQDNVIASPVHGNSADAIGNVSSNLGTMHL